MNHDTYDDSYIRGILTSVKSIAMVGASPVNVRPSYFAFKYLAERGYDMIPINPGQVGKNLVGNPFVGSLIDGQGQHNALIERVLAYPELRARMVAMTQRIAATTMAPDAVERRIAAALCDVAPDLAADERKRAANTEYPARLTEIRQFVAARGAVLRAVR